MEHVWLVLSAAHAAAFVRSADRIPPAILTGLGVARVGGPFGKWYVWAVLAVPRPEDQDRLTEAAGTAGALLTDVPLEHLLAGASFLVAGPSTIILRALGAVAPSGRV